jgi:hypothetical protein
VLQARLDALEDGGADDILAGDDVDEEFNMDDELDVEVTGTVLYTIIYMPSVTDICSQVLCCVRDVLDDELDFVSMHAMRANVRARTDQQYAM